MKIISKVAATAVLVFTLFPAVAANAQVDCARADYCNPNTPDVGGSDSGHDSFDTSGVSAGSAGAPVSGDSAGNGATRDGAEVLGAASEAPAAAVAAESGAAGATAPSGALPITGGDVIGIAAFGAAALGLGTVLVKRSKVARLA